MELQNKEALSSQVELSNFVDLSNLVEMGPFGAISLLFYLQNVLNSTSTTGTSPTFSRGGSSVWARSFDATDGLKLVEVAADGVAVEGMRYAQTVADGAGVGSEVWDDLGVTAPDGWIDNEDGTYSAVAATNILYDSVAVPGNWYQVTYTVDITAGSVRATGFGGGTIPGPTRSVSGTYTDEVLTMASQIGFDGVEAFTGLVSNVSARPAIPRWINSVSAADSSTLHPTNADGNYLEMDAWPGAGQTVTIGDFCIGKVGNHYHYFEATTGGTSGGSEPTWTDSGTVNDNTVVWTYGGRYSNLGPGVVPHVLHEPESENLFLQSGTVATQNITVAAVEHTLSVTGSGDITLSGVATGTATEGSPLTFTPTAGTLTCTLNGSLDTAQLEVGSAQTSYIPTTTAPVTRPATSQSGALVFADKIRLRYLGDGSAAVLLSDGTRKLEYTGTALEFTDGTTTLSAVTALAYGDTIGIDVTASAWALYLNGSAVDTDATGGAVTWGGTVYVATDSTSGSEVLGGITDLQSDNSLDLTDTTWIGGNPA